jgi:hypothetical protein
MRHRSDWILYVQENRDQIVFIACWFAVWLVLVFAAPST